MSDLSVTVTVNGEFAKVNLEAIVKEAMKEAARRSAFALEEEFRKGLDVAEMMRAHRKALEDHHLAAFFQACSDHEWTVKLAEMEREKLREEIKQLKSRLLTFGIEP